MTKETKDNISMFGRYAITVAIGFAVGRGWLTEAAGGTLGDFTHRADHRCARRNALCLRA